MGVYGKGVLAATFITSLLIGAGLCYVGFVNPLSGEVLRLESTVLDQSTQIGNLTSANLELSSAYEAKAEECEALNQGHIFALTELEDRYLEVDNALKDIREEHDELKERYFLVNESYSYLRNLVEGEKILMSFHRIIVEVSGDYIFYFSGLYGEEPDSASGILIGSREYATSTFSFSWYESAKAPNYALTLDEMYSTIYRQVQERGERQTTNINGYEVVYEIHRLSQGSGYLYLGYAIWYEPVNNISLIYAVQEPHRIFEAELLGFVQSFRYGLVGGTG